MNWYEPSSRVSARSNGKAQWTRDVVVEPSRSIVAPPPMTLTMCPLTQLSHRGGRSRSKRKMLRVDTRPRYAPRTGSYLVASSADNTAGRSRCGGERTEPPISTLRTQAGPNSGNRDVSSPTGFHGPYDECESREKRVDLSFGISSWRTSANFSGVIRSSAGYPQQGERRRSSDGRAMERRSRAASRANRVPHPRRARRLPRTVLPDRRSCRRASPLTVRA